MNQHKSLQLLINGKMQELQIDVSSVFLLQDLLSHLKIVGPHFAVAVNQEFVRRAQYQDLVLKNGDEIEIVSPMQGG